MSETSPADSNGEAKPAEDSKETAPAPVKPGSGAPHPEAGPTQKVSEKAQEDAAKDREEGGGYT